MAQIKTTNNALSITSQKSLWADAYFDKAFIYQFKSSWNGENYKHYSIYFEYAGEYFHYSYSSRVDFFDKYFNEAIAILNSFTFK